MVVWSSNVARLNTKTSLTIFPEICHHLLTDKDLGVANNIREYKEEIINLGKFIIFFTIGIDENSGQGRVSSL